MKKVLFSAAAVLGLLTAAEAGGSAYFYRRTMKRNHVSVERTMKMAGTDWRQYFPLIEERRARLLAKHHEEIYLESFDGLRLHATWFPAEEETEITKAAICFHGYSSCGMNDYVGLSDYYLRKGYSMLIVDERAHGKSQGEYIGFGCLDRKDALCWIYWVIGRCGGQTQIILHGISMGAATALMTTGLTLPVQVKGVISDCAFTSPKAVFSHVLRSMYHLPAFPMIQIADYVNRKKAGYGLDECNAAREVKKAKIPALLIHGSADTFVPCRMCDEIYENYASAKTKLIVEGAAHAESYYKDMDAYEKAMNEFLGGLIV